ncbi:MULTISPECIES: hypothetical protein [Paenarthrobacter]|uniref:hypothetical protein n=1 Tax=Paenarthrobacter TaxID=1742992 RepID=UPI001877E909|nr:MULTISPECIES: hypothetical protein [Paenarthrobacter]QOT18313.1 hypothetical protein HMI59_18050 [Paenarthrobacter sp. YJN-5]UOD81903.1 hypothetical protein MQZ73_03165 [Paenarthrobacter ureafaciens]WNZ05394.1 hypothetical protein PVT25_07705 [Paenarthrobacter ureafaciens]
MIVMDNHIAALHRGALQRQARQRVDLLDELRAVQNASSRGMNQRDIAEVLVTSQAKVHRMLKAIERRPDILSSDQPEELILRAFAYDTPRRELIEKLKSISYTDGEEAPYPDEGRIPGTWDQVVGAYAQELLTESEFNEVRAAVGR